MPKTPIDYSKTVIYKIVCNDLNITDLYVGHTTDFTKRKNGHKTDCNNINDKSYNLKVYKTIRENGNWENWTMIEIEKYPCDDGNEAAARNRHWYEVLNAKLNSCVPNRSQKEYQMEYRKNNKDNVKDYYENNKEKILQKNKEWYELNKDVILEKQKEYRNENKETIKQNRSEKFTCECGGQYSRKHKSTHLKSSKHQTYCSTILDV